MVASGGVGVGFDVGCWVFVFGVCGCSCVWVCACWFFVCSCVWVWFCVRALVCSARVWWCAGVFRGRVRCLVFRGVLWWWGGGRGLLVWVG